MTANLRGKHIVIIEDDSNLRELLKTYFQRNDVAISLFGDAESCLDQAHSLPHIHLFLVDYLLPKMNGIDLIKALRPQFSHAKMVVMTGHLDSAMAQEGLTFGIDSLIVKPFDFNILEKNLSELVEQASA